MKKTSYNWSAINAAPLLLILFLLNSCATILNSEWTRLKVMTDEPAVLVVKYDTMLYYTIPSEQGRREISVLRSKEPLCLSVINDSITKTISIQSQNSFAYWLNLYPSVHLWTGFLIDNNKPKRYTYAKRVYVDMNDTVARYYTFYPWSRKGDIDLRLSLPYVNSFLLKHENGSVESSQGFWGINLGVDYYHSHYQFVSLGASGVLDFFLPVPASVGLFGVIESTSSSYIYLSNNHTFKGYTLGYGLSYSTNTWEIRYYRDYDPSQLIRVPENKTHTAWGLYFPLHYWVTEHFGLGFIYRPTFYRPNLTEKFKYEYLFSIDFAWKIGLKNQNKIRTH